jgi:serine/threonine protein kinase
MSVEASESMSEVWTGWQGHVINGVFTLGRYLGCSDHSGVFLTQSIARHPSEVAIKLVPTTRSLAESQLPRWKRAGSLAHPHLLRLLESGGCQLDGLPYLYAVMEYADQTLAQLLLHRALTDDEAREMLLPILDALAFLHSRDLVQGQLQPANILVVGDQLKLASDTIRRVSEGTISNNTPTVYDPPEAWNGGSSTAGDIWALGVTLFEGLTRRSPASWGEPRGTVVLPADFSPVWRDVVARCLSPRPQDRPHVTELLAWARGASVESAPATTSQPAAVGSAPATTSQPAAVGSAPAATIHPAAVVPPQQRTPEPAPLRTESPPKSARARTESSQVGPEAARPAPSLARSPRPRVSFALLVGAVVIVALGWTAVSVFRTHRSPAAPPPPAQAPAELTSQIPAAAAPATTEMRAHVSGTSTTKPSGSAVATSPSALHEVIPNVPWSARRSIRGHIKVWVRVIVAQDGSVFAALVDRTGPSTYFQQLAVEAAKKWTFPATETPSQRLMQVRFDFSRDGTTGRAVTVH